MARSLEDYQREASASVTPPDRDRRATRSTARAFAAAISALAISALVIATSAEALTTEGTANTSGFSAGTIMLTDDDNDRALFNLENMAPGRPTTECINVIYEGSILPVDASMSVTADGPLSPYLLVRVERGTGAGFDECVGFEPAETIFEGNVSTMAAEGQFALGRFLNQGDEMAFRMSFEMADVQDAVGLATAVDFAWEVSPE